ncbi:hypothetical protein Barb4_05380 [Bacteroidales bacterium Barb4]|jgi:hypothetical protein|nr:hypothetical protein Barb4_05380 [Bacteroidales bacterium Barb4]
MSSFLESMKHKIAEMDRDISKLSKKRDALKVAYDVMVEEAPIIVKAKAKGTIRPRYKGPVKNSNIGRAIAMIQSSEQGLTLGQLIQRSSDNGQKPFTSSSISSQLRQMVLRDVIGKTGEVYHAVR